MSIVSRLKDLELDPSTLITLSYSDGADVFVHNETEVDTALSETDVVSRFCNLIATPKIHPTTAYGTDILEEMRDGYYLNDYERGSDDFADYLCEVVTDNFYDFEFIEHSVEKYDYKRGFCRLSAEVQLSLSEILETNVSLTGWEISVPVDGGTLTFD